MATHYVLNPTTYYECNKDQVPRCKLVLAERKSYTAQEAMQRGMQNGMQKAQRQAQIKQKGTRPGDGTGALEPATVTQHRCNLNSDCSDKDKQKRCAVVSNGQLRLGNLCSEDSKEAFCTSSGFCSNSPELLPYKVPEEGFEAMRATCETDEDCLGANKYCRIVHDDEAWNDDFEHCASVGNPFCFRDPKTQKGQCFAGTY
jgi:hypothetical protein